MHQNRSFLKLLAMGLLLLMLGLLRAEHATAELQGINQKHSHLFHIASAGGSGGWEYVFLGFEGRLRLPFR